MIKIILVALLLGGVSNVAQPPTAADYDRIDSQRYSNGPNVHYRRM